MVERRVPSARGYLLMLKLRAEAVSRGLTVADKTRLLLWALVDSIPNIIIRRSAFLEHLALRVKNQLAKRATLNFGKYKLRCVDSECIAIIHHEFERWMWDHLRVCRGCVFVDVGAHVGKYTVPVAKIVGDEGLVVAVEPHPENYETLVENIELNGLSNVVALNIAAWSGEGALKLFIGDSGGHHSLKVNRGLGSVEVRARALDDVLDELGVERVDCVKIDVEGAELEVLKGLVKTLERFRPTVIVEAWEPERIREFAEERGYAMRRISPETPPIYYVLEPMR
ncbi:MAG: FkbM family methyltransferase [Fervidicoccaceae archaeon]